jgi:hypothetical protein
MTIPASAPTFRLRGSPGGVFVSVDQTSGRSAISFLPAEVGDPILNEDDRTGAAAMALARDIVAAHPGCVIHGPHFHAGVAARKRMVRRPAPFGKR